VSVSLNLGRFPMRVGVSVRKKRRNHMQRTDEILLVRLFLRSTLTNWKGVSISKG
jgi:hypothetical protein